MDDKVEFRVTCKEDNKNVCTKPMLIDPEVKYLGYVSILRHIVEVNVCCIEVE